MRAGNNLRILAALLRKELKLMRRNPIVPKIILVMPLMVMLVLPLVATMDVKEARVAVADYDRSQLSRRVAADIDASESMALEGVYATHAGALRAVERGAADVALTIPRGWAKRPGPLSAEANGVNATRATLSAQYVSASVAATLTRQQAEEGAARRGGTAAEAGQAAATVTHRYNPTLDFRHFMIPALLVILLIIICGFIPTLSLAGEKESGTIEAMNVTPAGRGVFVLSKLLPYWGAGMVVVAEGMAVGWLVYGLSPAGSIWDIVLAALLFSFVMSGLGVAVAARSATMLQSIMVMFAIIMVFQLMGGLFTPVSSMPGWAQTATLVIPPRYFNEIVRGVYLKGACVADLWPQYLALAVMACAAFALAAFSYRKRS